MLRWSNGIARHEIKWCTSSNAASASRFGLLRDEMVFSRALVEQTCLGAPEQHKREPRRPKPVPYTRIRRLRRPGNFWRFFGVFSGQIRFRTRMARTPVGGPDRNAQKADFQYPASMCIVRGPILDLSALRSPAPPNTTNYLHASDAGDSVRKSKRQLSG